MVVNYSSNAVEGQKVVDEIKSNERGAILVKADGSREEDVKALFSETVNQFGRLDVLVSNAGLQKDAPFLEMTLGNGRRLLTSI